MMVASFLECLNRIYGILGLYQLRYILKHKSVFSFREHKDIDTKNIIILFSFLFVTVIIVALILFGDSIEDLTDIDDWPLLVISSIIIIASSLLLFIYSISLFKGIKGKIKQNFPKSVKISSFVIGIKSACLYEAMLFNVPVVVQQYVLTKILDPQLFDYGAAAPVFSPDQLEAKIKKALFDDDFRKCMFQNQKKL